MHRVSRPIAAGLAGLALVAALAGCGGQPTTSAPTPRPAAPARSTPRPFPTSPPINWEATQTARETQQRLRKLECEAENAKARAQGLPTLMCGL